MITSMVPGFDPVVVTCARGTRVHCASGREYLDCCGGVAVRDAGHGHPKVIAAAMAQMDELPSSANTTSATSGPRTTREPKDRPLS